MSGGERSLHDLIIETVHNKAIQLPIFNSVALRLQQALKRPETRVSDVEEMLIEDQSLASQILRVSNAAFYKGLQPITTIRKAIIRLGIQKVATLAMIAAQQQMYQKISPTFQSYQSKLWEHSFASATGSRWLAERAGFRAIAENAFLAGLLHNIGQLALIKIIAELYATGFIPTDMPHSLIAEILGSPLHTEQGYTLAAKWNLPEEYCFVVRDHHVDPPDPSNTVLLFVRLVDQACEKLGIGLTSDPQISLAVTPEAQILGMSEIALAELEILLEDSVKTADEVL